MFRCFQPISLCCHFEQNVQQRLYGCIWVCVLLLATATTKQPPLVTKLSLTSSRHSDQSELLISSTQDCSWACNVYVSGRMLFSVAEFAHAIAHVCGFNAIAAQRQLAILVPDSPPEHRVLQPGPRSRILFTVGACNLYNAWLQFTSGVLKHNWKMV